MQLGELANWRTKFPASLGKTIAQFVFSMIRENLVRKVQIMFVLIMLRPQPRVGT
jgi:hypothetical protein